MAEVERAFLPTANLMAMYASSKTGKQHSPMEYMPDFNRRERRTDGPGIEAYNSFARAAGINAKG